MLFFTATLSTLTLYGHAKTAEQRTITVYSNTVIRTLAADGWAVTFGTTKRGLGEMRLLASAQSPPRCTKRNSPPTNSQCTMTF